nr:MAG: methyltransferase [Leptolyngbya sp. IPPAS B-1204]
MLRTYYQNAEPTPNLSGLLSLKSLLKGWLHQLVEKVLLKRQIDHFQYIIGGPVYFQTIRTACQLDLFGLLTRKPGLTQQQIAQALKLEENPTKVLLLGCVSLKFLRKIGEQYYNAPFVSQYFSQQGQRSLIPTLEWMHQIVYPSMVHLYASVTQNEAVGLQVFPGNEDNMYARISHNQQLEHTFQTFMQARTQMSNADFVNAVDFSKFSRILDVGGARGENVVKIAQRYPSIQATVFDLPSVTQTALSRFRTEGLDHRLDAVGGNIFAETFPLGYDCILFCHFTPIWSESTNREMLRKAFTAVNSGGCVCIYAPFMEDDETGPLLSAIASPYFLCTVSGQGRHYSWQETKQWLIDAGFVNIAERRLRSSEGILIGIKPV